MKFSSLLALLMVQPLSAITIEIDYSLDDTNFFDTPEKREAIEAVAQFFGDLIQDNLLRIDPSEFPGASWTPNISDPVTGNTISLTDLSVVEEDTIIVFVGARELGGTTRGIAGPGSASASGFTSWFERVFGRGSAGAAAGVLGGDPTLATDFAPWGGSIAFDITTDFNFSLTENASGSDFISVALHEMGHVLGIGTADSWFNLISNTGLFTGAASTRSFGSSPTVQSGGGHFQSAATIASVSYGSFGTPHATARPALMVPSISSSGTNLTVFSDLDLAALIDLGWEIVPPLVLNTTSLNPTNAVFTWPSSSFLDYRVLRGTTPQSLTGGSSEFDGDGSVQSWTDPATPPTTAFYRLLGTEVFPAASSVRAAPSKAQAASSEAVSTIAFQPRLVTGCSCFEHGE